MYIIRSPLSDACLYQLLAIFCVCSSVVVAQSPSQTSLAPTWPTGTEAQASSVHSQNDDGTTFYDSNAIDGNFTTKWNDDSLAAYPDTLTISIPTAVTLSGIFIISGEDGWLLEYTVETYNGTDWTTAAEIRNATSPLQLINFLEPVLARKVRINVTQDQSGPNTGGEFTRIHEVYPLFDTSSSSASTSTSTSSASISTSTSTSTSPTDKSTSKKCSNAGAIAGGVIGGVAVIMLAALAGFFVFIRRRNNGGSGLPEPRSDLYPQELAPGSPHPVANTHQPAGETEHSAYSATSAEPSNRAARNFRQVHEKPAELPNSTTT